MNKEQIISMVRSALVAGTIGREDLLSLTSSGTAAPTPEVAPTGSRFPINAFYAIGAVIAVTGAIILISQHWDDIGFAGRILVTLGLSFVTYVIALLTRTKNTLSQVLFTISAALAPIGAYVFVTDANGSFSFSTQIVSALMLLVVFSVAQWIARKQILTLVMVAFGTWAYYAFFLNMFDSFQNVEWIRWATVFLGLAYLCIAYGYSKVSMSGGIAERTSVTSILYFIGTGAFLGAFMSLGGIFDLLFILVVCGTFYLAAHLHSRGMLVLSGVFLMAHIVKLSGRYFANSIGWPITLIFCGFIVIGVGYMTYYLNKKYVSQQVS